MTEGQPLERRVVSVLFADLVGFTALSEGLDAEEVAQVQDRYFGQVRETIGRYGGRLEKFIGDAAMAVFGVPRTRDDDAERAVRAGLALVGAVEALSARIGLAEGALRLRVGVNTGEVAYALADDGEWRVSGDTVNSASRLQTAAEPGSVLVGDGTALAVAEVIVVDRPVELALKGKAEPVRAWRAVTPLPQRSRERAMGGLRAPLLGRDRETAQIRAAIDRAGSGATETLLVIAPPGVGKSRLVDELADRSGQEEIGRLTPVLHARLGPETTSPAAAVTQLLLSALDRDLGPLPPGDEIPRQSRVDLVGELLRLALPSDRAAELTTEMTRLLSEGVQSAAHASASDLAQERELRFRAWIEALDALGGRQSQIWVIEDLHWSGGDLLAFVVQAHGQPAPNGRLLLGTARPIFLDQLAARGDAGSLPLLELPPLAGADAGALVLALVGDALPPALVDAIVIRSDGNPLFVEELLRTWVSLGLLIHEADGKWRLAAPMDDVSLPQTVQQIYAAQLDDLPADARALVRRASVAGRNLPRRSLDALDLARTEDALSVARRRALLTDAPPDVISGPMLSYRHALLRDAGYGSLARAERGRLHARLAAWYEEMAGGRADEVAEQIAGHYAAALEHASRLSPVIDDGLDVTRARDLAIGWYERAARRALADAAHETARSLLREALRHADESMPMVRARLLLGLGEATAYTADMDEGGRLLVEAVGLYRRALDEPAEDDGRTAARTGYAAAAAALGRVWIQQVRFDETDRLADEALARIGGPDDAEVARLLGMRAWVHSTLRPDRAVLVDLDRALAIARHAGDRRLELEVLDWRAGALGEIGAVQIEDWQHVERLAIELGDWSRAVKAMRVQASFHLDDHHDEVWELADRAEAIARRRGQEEDVCWLDYLRAEAGLVSGDWDRAMAAGRRVIEVGERNSYHRAVVRTIHVLLPIATARSDRATVEHAHAWHEARKHMFPDSPYARVMRAAIELHSMHHGLLEPAVPEVEPRLESFEGEPGGPSWLAAVEEVVESWIAAGELAGVRDALERMDRGVAQEPQTSHLGRGTAAYLRARLIGAEGASVDEVRDQTRRALAEFRQSGAPWWIAKTLRLLHSLGDAGADEVAELRSIEQRLGLAV